MQPVTTLQEEPVLQVQYLLHRADRHQAVHPVRQRLSRSIRAQQQITAAVQQPVAGWTETALPGQGNPHRLPTLLRAPQQQNAAMRLFGNVPIITALHQHLIRHTITAVQIHLPGLHPVIRRLRAVRSVAIIPRRQEVPVLHPPIQRHPAVHHHPVVRMAAGEAVRHRAVAVAAVAAEEDDNIS